MTSEYQQQESDIGVAPDLDSSSDDYASRFSGPAGEWLVSIQSAFTQKHVSSVSPSKILDVGGGHAQNVVPIESLSIPLTIAGSHIDCSQRVMRFRSLDSTQFICSTMIDLNFEDRSYPHVISYRIVSHMTDWKAFIRELCRVSDDAVTIDFATKRSFNILSELAYQLKKGQEGNTRRFHVLSENDVDDCFADAGFQKMIRSPQFFWPMAIHRKMNMPKVSSLLEGMARVVGLSTLFGSPVIATYRRVKR